MVQAVRHLLAQRRFAVLLCAAALLLKLLLPAGYMIAVDHGRIAITPCSGIAPRPMAGMDHAMHGQGGSANHGGEKDHGKAGMPCAFAGLTAASTGAIDPVQLAALIAYIVVAGLCGAAPPPARAGPAYLRPPLRGPPARL